jgi:hypothetical protein
MYSEAVNIILCSVKEGWSFLEHLETPKNFSHATDLDLAALLECNFCYKTFAEVDLK